MKLKEKLAKKYLASHFVNECEGYNLTEEEIFLAGFEKAREMAIEAVSIHRCREGKPNDLASCFPDRPETRLQFLGEEEVSE